MSHQDMPSDRQTNFIRFYCLQLGPGLNQKALYELVKQDGLTRYWPTIWAIYKVVSTLDTKEVGERLVGHAIFVANYNFPVVD